MPAARKTVYIDANNIRQAASGIAQVMLHLLQELCARPDDELRYVLVMSPKWSGPDPSEGLHCERIVHRPRRVFVGARCPRALRAAREPTRALWHALYGESTGLSYFRDCRPIVTIHDAYGNWKWHGDDASPDLDGWPWESWRDHPNHRTKMYSPKRRTGHRMARLAARHAGTLAYVSTTARAQFEAEHEVGPEVQHVVIPNGVSLPETPARRPKWLPERPFLLAMSHFQANKNLRCLPDCLPHLPDDWLLVLSGHNSNAHGQAIRAHCQQHRAGDRVLLPGSVPDDEKKWLLAHGLAFLMPSLIEGFGLPAAESMLSGRPAVVTNIPAFRETCAEHAFYIQRPDDPEHIAAVTQQAIRAYAEQPALADQARAHARQFSQQRFARRYRQLYLEHFARIEAER